MDSYWLAITAPLARRAMAPARMMAPGRRGVVLLVVMLIITLAALIGTSVLYVADAQRGSATLTLRQAQLRALAWSGVQAAMVEIAGQRTDLMKGGLPTLTGSWVLWEGRRGGEVCLTAIGGEGVFTTSEAARLDVNLATPAMLAKLPGMSEALAGEIIKARGAGFSAPEESGRVAALGPAVLLDVGADEKAENRGRRGLLTLTSVFAAEPNVEPATGEAKVNVSGGWTSELATELGKRLTAGVLTTLQPALTNAKNLKAEADLRALVEASKMSPSDRASALDVLTVSDDQYIRGKVDVNRAPVEVLAAVPGIDEAAAEKLVDMRSKLGADELGKVSWPRNQGVLSAAAYAQAAEWLTVRSLQWRVRVEARLGNGTAEAKAGAIENLGGTLKAQAEHLDEPGMVWEAVIDVAGEVPRVAYLRDVTHLDAVLSNAVAQEPSEPVAAEKETKEASVEGDPGAPAAKNGAREGALQGQPLKGAGFSASGSLKMERGLKLGEMKVSGGLKMESGLKLNSSLDLGDREGSEGDQGALQSEGGGARTPVSERRGTQDRAPKDRRIGRWRGRSE